MEYQAAMGAGDSSNGASDGLYIQPKNSIIHDQNFNGFLLFDSISVEIWNTHAKKGEDAV